MIRTRTRFGVIAALLAAFALCGTARAQDAGLGRDLAAANASYQQGDYRAARGAYEQLLQRYGQRSGVLYNLGNACYEMGETGWAIVYYERALLINPRDRDLRANLATALGARRSATSTAAPASWRVVARYLMDRFTVNELTLSALVVYLAAALLALVWLGQGTLRRRHRWLLWALLALFVATGALAAGKARTSWDPRRIVLVADAQLLTGPADSFPAVCRAYQGEMGQMVQADGLWREVRLESGPRGWVMQSSLASPVPDQAAGTGSAPAG